MKRLVLAAVGLGIAGTIEASKFQDSFIINENSRVGPIVEGPMYGEDGAFIGIASGSPFVGFEGNAMFVAGDEPSSMHANLTIFHTSSERLLQIYDKSIPVAERLLNKSNHCDTSRGQATQSALHAYGRFVSSEVYELSGGGSVTPINFKSGVRTTGYQYIVFILCKKHHKDGVQGGVQVEVTGELTFRNPYGYLPARYYGFLPFLGILSAVYLVMLLVYGYLACTYRKAMLRMQWGVLGVLAMGMIETTTWFLTYVVMNDTGETSCCPWRTDIVFAMFAKNLKQTVSGMLVLAVALGWGVVRPALTRRTTVLILLLGFFYLAFSVKFDLVRMEKISYTSKSDDVDQAGGNAAFWAFPVALCDVLFILSIYFGLVETCTELENDHQEAKLKMYQVLSSTLRLWGVLWLMFTVFDLLTRIGFIPWPWTLEFLLWGFWDVLYLGVLLRIAIIWRPTETSDRYAYSAQLPTEHVLDEFETQEFEENSKRQEMEMTAT